MTDFEAVAEDIYARAESKFNSGDLGKNIKNLTKNNQPASAAIVEIAENLKIIADEHIVDEMIPEIERANSVSELNSFQRKIDTLSSDAKRRAEIAVDETREEILQEIARKEIALEEEREKAIEVQREAMKIKERDKEEEIEKEKQRLAYTERKLAEKIASGEGEADVLAEEAAEQRKNLEELRKERLRLEDIKRREEREIERAMSKDKRKAENAKRALKKMKARGEI